MTSISTDEDMIDPELDEEIEEEELLATAKDDDLGDETEPEEDVDEVEEDFDEEE